jgi:hypothetical protein
MTDDAARAQPQRELAALDEAARRAWRSMPAYARRTTRPPAIGSTQLVFSDAPTAWSDDDAHE